ncbi:hypothetical protein BJ878DRAFT_221883 [Calycina marina]|uniref:Uncharacterized protein n=1 Tax=Calycina marina TaxID=1763456 RepID=A0A9P8CC26_9HELO|nr:hypothetical protein BJ878DRAFT_221883 [Calycina marina]
MKAITINLIGSVGFGTTRLFIEAGTTPNGLRTTSVTPVLTLVNDPSLEVFIPAKILLLSFVSKAANDIGTAKLEFPLHLQKSSAKERRCPSFNTLVASLVRIADQDKSPTAEGSKSLSYLTEEIMYIISGVAKLYYRRRRSLVGGKPQ